MMRLALLLSLLFCSACVYVRTDSRVFLTSDPPGADVAIDGKETGMTTPTILDFDGLVNGDHEITLHKNGHDPETRKVIHHKILYTSRWEDGAADPGIIALFLFWTFGDMTAFFGVRWNYEPHELHVKLYERGEFVLRRGEQKAEVTPQQAPESRK